MFSFWGWGGGENDETKNDPNIATEETIAQKSSSGSAVLVENDDAHDEGVVVDRRTAPTTKGVISPAEVMHQGGDAGSSLLVESDDEDEDEDDDMDLELVEAFDKTFNEFCAAYPKFLMANPDLVHSLRVTKLQKLLSDADYMENELIQQLEQLQAEKHNKEASLQHHLTDAARKKAAREIHLQSQLGELQSKAKETQEKLKWKLLVKSEMRAKKQHNQRQYFQAEIVGGDRLDLLAELPDHPDFEDLREAILDSGTASQDRYLREHGNMLTPEQEQELSQLQVDNAILNSQVSMLTKRLDYQKLAAKKNAWVESVLVRMDDKTLKKLKSKQERKTGVFL
jgi:hypothetical protein